MIWWSQCACREHNLSAQGCVRKHINQSSQSTAYGALPSPSPSPSPFPSPFPPSPSPSSPLVKPVCKLPSQLFPPYREGGQWGEIQGSPQVESARSAGHVSVCGRLGGLGVMCNIFVAFSSECVCGRLWTFVVVRNT